MAKTCLLALARHELTRALHRPAGISTSVLVEEPHGQLVVMALRYDAHTAGVPMVGPWTVQVIAGRVQIREPGSLMHGYPGDLLTGTADALMTPIDDCVVLLTLPHRREMSGEVVHLGAVGAGTA